MDVARLRHYVCPLWDELEQWFASPEMQQRVRELQEPSALVLDSEGKERALVGEVFTIRDERHARYWMAQAFHVLPVIRRSEGEVRWMEARDWLKRASGEGRRPVKRIVFAGERFDVMGVRRWRDRVVGRGSS